LKNGLLLREAELQFEVFISTDQNLKYQQKVIGRNLALLIRPTNDWSIIRRKTGEGAAKIAELKPGEFVELEWI
jgi:hypothetical protein